MNEGPMTATEIRIRMELFWKEKKPEFDRAWNKLVGNSLTYWERVIHTRTILGPPSTFIQDSWDLICVAMVISTLAFMTWLTLHVNGAL